MEQLDPQTLATLNQEQALSVFTSAGEAIRFLASERWQVTYFVFLAYVALVTTPELICKNVANCVCLVANASCAVVAFLLLFPASYHLLNLQEQHAELLCILDAAEQKLPVVLELVGQPDRPGRVYWGLLAALIIGAVLVICINGSRIASSRRTVAHQSDRSP
jgi:hypothetical protein